MIGKTLAHYEITALLGKGGMGEVYRAHDTKLQRDVALKILPEEVARDPERVARFEREARTLATLRHPNVATIHGIDEAEGHRFLVMELVEGEDLQQKLRRGALPVEELVPIARQMAEGMEAAHERGIVHRDLKPANVKVDPEGNVKILDFGLARAYVGDPTDPAEFDHSPTITAAMTQAGVILGTAAYMSPEQARGKSVDRRSDIWAFGVILYEALTGSRLFGGETLSDTMAGVLKTPVDLDELPGDTPTTLRWLLKRCLDRDPRTRLRDIGEARVVLEQPISAEEPIARRAGSRRLGFGPVAGVAIAAVAGFLLGRMLLPVKDPAPLQSVKFEIPILPPENTTRFALDSAGTKLVYTDDFRLFVRHLDQVGPSEVPQSEGALVCNWSPNGEWIVYATGTKAYKAKADGTQRFLLCDLPDGMHDRAGGIAWLDDGTIVFSTGSSALWQVSNQGGNPTALLEPREDELDFHGAVALPQGKGVMFGPHSTNDMSRIDVLANGARSTIIQHPGQFMGKATYSQGHLVYHRIPTNDGVWAVPFSLETLEATGDPFLLIPHGRFPTASENGHLAYMYESEEMRQLVVLDGTGLVKRVVIDAQAGLDPFFSLSPDGTQVAVAIRAEDDDIWIYDVEDGARRRFVFGDESQVGPAWSPTEDHIVYLSGRVVAREVYLRTLSGSQTTQLPLVGVDYLAFSSDGQTLVVMVNDDALDDDLAYIGLNDGEMTMLLDRDGADAYPALSPDGRYLAYQSDTSGRHETYIREFPAGEGEWQVSQDGGTHPYWSQEGDRLYFRNGRRFMEVEIDLEPALTLGPPRLVFESDLLVNIAPTRAPDEFMAVARVRDTDERPPAITVWLNWSAGLETALP